MLPWPLVLTLHAAKHVRHHEEAWPFAQDMAFRAGLLALSPLPPAGLAAAAAVAGAELVRVCGKSRDQLHLHLQAPPSTSSLGQL